MRVEPVAVLSDNYAYLVICEETKLAAAVDPADAAKVLARADALGVQLAAIWGTHHHYDHTGGNEDLIAACGERGWSLEVLGSSVSTKIPGMTRGLDDDEVFELGQLQGRAIHTPGHTLDAVTFLVQEQHAFTGDTLFGAGCGRIFEGDPPTTYRSLNKLAALSESTRVWFGHEYTVNNLGFALAVEPNNPASQQRFEAAKALVAEGKPTIPSTIAIELATNPFLRCGRADLQSAVSMQGEDPVAVFAEVRHRRNSW